MRKTFLLSLVLASTLLPAHYGVFLIGQVEKASHNVWLKNPVLNTKIRTVEFKNLGSEQVTISHMRFYQPQEAMALSFGELTLGPGQALQERFLDYPDYVTAVEFFVHGETELLEVTGIVD